MTLRRAGGFSALLFCLLDLAALNASRASDLELIGSPALSSAMQAVLAAQQAPASAGASASTQNSSIGSVGAVFEKIISSPSQGSATGLLTEMKASFVERAFFKYYPPKSLAAWNADLSQLAFEAAVLRKANPGIVLQGGITGAYLNANPRDTWPDGSPITDSEFDSMVLKDAKGNKVPFSPGSNAAYLGDILSPNFQKFLVGWCEPQIDAGMDSLFFDEPFQAALYRVNTWHEDPARVYPRYAKVFEDEIAEPLRSYARFQGVQKLWIGKNDMRLFTYSTQLFLLFPELIKDDDLIMGTFEDQDFTPSAGGAFLIAEQFPSMVSLYNSIMGRAVPIVMFIDWPHAMTEFASLSKEDQIKLLKILDAMTKAAGIMFSYPVYGGTILENGNKSTYDSTQVGTFSTIDALATQSR